MAHPLDFDEERRYWICPRCGARRQLIAYAWPKTTAGLYRPLLLTCWAEGVDRPHTWAGAEAARLPL